MKVEIKDSKWLLVEHSQAVEDALRRAVNHALLMHKRAGNPIASWKDGKVVLIPPEEIVVPDDKPTNES